ncbi:hypothetical protein VNI00_016516 [Paramarasmius palmivorus]|uniref:SWIM-type domain-containing protein n=1 Tax=Paramarasmius palmivorus TaxID=297713 RepID=A0AAW0BF51_9AGAR
MPTELDTELDTSLHCEDLGCALHALSELCTSSVTALVPDWLEWQDMRQAALFALIVEYRKEVNDIAVMSDEWVCSDTGMVHLLRIEKDIDSDQFGSLLRVDMDQIECRCGEELFSVPMVYHRCLYAALNQWEYEEEERQRASGDGEVSFEKVESDSESTHSEDNTSNGHDTSSSSKSSNSDDTSSDSETSHSDEDDEGPSTVNPAPPTLNLTASLPAQDDDPRPSKRRTYVDDGEDEFVDPIPTKRRKESEE